MVDEQHLDQVGKTASVVLRRQLCRSFHCGVHAQRNRRRFDLGARSTHHCRTAKRIINSIKCTAFYKRHEVECCMLAAGIVR